MNVPRELARTATMQAVSLPDPSRWMRESPAHLELSRRQRPSAFHKSDFPITWGFHVLRFCLFLLFTQLLVEHSFLCLILQSQLLHVVSKVIEEKMVIIIAMSPLIELSSVAQSCPTLCDPMNHSTPGLPIHHQLPEFTQIHVHWVGDAIQPSHPLSSPSPAFNLS